VLLPKVYREPFYGKRPNLEYWAGERFRSRSRYYASRVTDLEAHLSWLLMMQHYGAPNRLLDWTANILVAIYFSIGESEEDRRQDGEIWCMNAQSLKRVQRPPPCWAQ
jgi:hypothetical protein